MNNIVVLIGAGVISLTIFFTFSQDEKTSNSGIDKVSMQEYSQLQERLSELQSKMNMLDGKGTEVTKLQKEIQSLKDKMAKTSKKSNSIVGTANIHTYLNSKNIEEVSNYDESLKVYKEKTDNNEQNEVIPPTAPAIAAIDTNEGKIYYSVDSNLKSVSVITTNSDNTDELIVEDKPSSNSITSTSPVLPPNLFGESPAPTLN